MKDMAIIVDGTALPLFKTFSEQVDAVEAENITLDGSLYTDFTSVRRSWVVGWEKLKAVDYETIRSLYNQQYTTESIPIVEIPEYGIVTPMKMSISARDIRLNGEIIEGFSLVLKEQYAVS